MSFILDALRKSELERKRQTGPSLATAPESTRRPGTPWVLLALAVLLALNLVGLLAFWIWRETRTPTTAEAAAPVAARAAPAAPGQRVVRPLAAEATTPQVIEELPDIAPPPEPALLPQALAPTGAPLPPPATAARAADTTEYAGVPRIDQLSPAATAGLPELNMDLHVYQPDAARRFVFINGVRYGENATTREGPVVEHITRDGAVLNYRGVRFLIERP